MIIEKTENGIYKMLDLSELPKKRRGEKEVVDWVQTKDKVAFFEYKGIKGEFRITSLPRETSNNTWLLLNYHEKSYRISSNNLLNLHIGKIIGEHGVRFKVGDIVCNSKVLKHKRLSTKNKDFGYELRCLETGLVYERSHHNVLACETSPFVSGRRAHPGNWLYSEEWLHRYVREPETLKQLTRKSSVKMEVICPICKKSKKNTVHSLVEKGEVTCSTCSSKRSFPERVMSALLNMNNIEFTQEKIFEGAGSRRFDFYLQKHNTVIETHGIQHYKERSGYYQGKLKKIQEDDLIKERFCERAGIEHIVVDCSYSSIEFILEEVSKNPFLQEILPVRDKEEVVFIMARGDIELQNMWRDRERGESYRAIGEKYGVTLDTVRNRLLQNDKHKIKDEEVVLLNDNLIFKSASEVAKIFHLHKKCVVSNCLNNNGGKTRHKSAGKHPITGEKMQWLYYKHYKHKEEAIRFNKETHKKYFTPIYKKIVCLTTLVFFECVDQASRVMEVPSLNNHIHKHLKGERKFVGRDPLTNEPLKWMRYSDYIEKYGTEGLTEYVEDKRELL